MCYLKHIALPTRCELPGIDFRAYKATTKSINFRSPQPRGIKGTAFKIKPQHLERQEAGKRALHYNRSGPLTMSRLLSY